MAHDLPPVRRRPHCCRIYRAGNEHLPDRFVSRMTACAHLNASIPGKAHKYRDEPSFAPPTQIVSMAGCVTWPFLLSISSRRLPSCCPPGGARSSSQSRCCSNAQTSASDSESVTNQSPEFATNRPRHGQSLRGSGWSGPLPNVQSGHRGAHPDCRNVSTLEGYALETTKVEARSLSTSTVSTAVDAHQSAAAFLSGARPNNRVNAVSAVAESLDPRVSANAQAQAAALLKGP
jgi:hypothetical protein